MKNPKILIFIILFLTIPISLVGVVFAFTGPTLPAGQGGGTLQLDGSGNIGFGTNLATPTGDATNANFGRVFTIASTSDPGIALRNLSSGGGKYIIYSRANGRFVVWDDVAIRPRFFIESNGNVGISGNSTSFFTPSSTLHVAGSVQTEGAFVGQLAPSSITGGAFQATNYAFPSALGVGTSSIAGLPTNGLFVAGNVGIGTKSPGTKLHLYDAINNAQIKLESDGSDDSSDILIDRPNAQRRSDIYFTTADVTDWVIGTLYNGGAPNSKFSISSDSTLANSKFIVDTNGNIGVGTTAPGGLLTLRYGDASVNNGMAKPILKLDVAPGAENSNVLEFRAFSSNGRVMQISQNAVGTQGVGANPTVTKYSNSYGSNQIVLFAPDTTTEDTTTGGIYFNTTPTSNDTSVSTRMFIRTDGNVGIGTASPTNRFHTVGVGSYPANLSEIPQYSHIRFQPRNDQGGSLYITGNSDSSALILQGALDGTTARTISLNPHGGNVGIGTNAPGQKLSVAGVIESTTGGIKFPDGSIQLTAGGGGSSVGWSRTGTYVTLTTTTDWVAIGTTTPTQALHVQGNAYISGNITTGGTMTTNVGASNVSAGTFGYTAGKGNYTFEGAASTNNVLKVDATNERVGIGTGSPSAKLTLTGGNLFLGTDNSVIGRDDGTIRQGNIQFASSVGTIIRYGGTDILSVTSASNVGIGTTGPGYKLDVLQGSGEYQTVRIGNIDTDNTLKKGGIVGRHYSNTEGVVDMIGYYSDNNNHSVMIGNNSGNSPQYIKLFTSSNGTSGGSERMRIDSSGNIGVGTTDLSNINTTAVWQFGLSPSDRLLTLSSVASSSVLNLETQVALNDPTKVGQRVGALVFSTSQGQGDAHRQVAGITSRITGYTTYTYYSDLGFFTKDNGGPTEKMTITSGGNIGIGTTTPASKLHVVGDIRATGNVIAGGTMTANVGAGNVSAGTFGITAGKGNYVFEAAANTNNVLKIDATNERVGVGESGPTTALDVKKDVPAASGTAPILLVGNKSGNWGNYAMIETRNVPDGRAVRFGSYLGSSSYAQGGFAVVTGVNGDIASTPTTKFFVRHDGNVGIGTMSPAGKLTVQEGELLINNNAYSGSSNGLSLKMDSGDNNIYIVSKNGNNLNLGTDNSVDLTIKQGGNVGIGTTAPAFKTQIQGEATTLLSVHRQNSDLLETSPIGMTFGMRGDTGSGSSDQRAGIFYEYNGKLYISAKSGVTDLATSPKQYAQIFVDGVNDRVGIGTTTPSYRLHVNGSAKFENPIEVGSPSSASHATTKSYVDSLLTGGSTSGSLSTLIVSGTTTLASTAGKVTIGGAGPSLKLDVIGQGQFTDTISATKYYDYNDPTYYIDPANTGTALKLGGSIQSDGSGTSYVLGNTLIGTATNPGSYRFAVSGTSYFSNQVTVNANLLLGTSQNITLQTGNITGVNKITAAIIDPLYEIDGKKYATYGAAIAGGLYEEYIGRGNLQPTTYNLQQGNGEEKISNSQCSIFNQNSNTNDSIDTSLKTENCKLQNYAYIIDFNKVERGSDLWLWYQVVDFGEDTVQAIVTPIGESANIYYEIENNKIIFNSDKPAKFSFRLSGKRHDYKEWPTEAKDQKEKASFILKAK